MKFSRGERICLALSLAFIITGILVVVGGMAVGLVVGVTVGLPYVIAGLGLTLVSLVFTLIGTSLAMFDGDPKP